MTASPWRLNSNLDYNHYILNPSSNQKSLILKVIGLFYEDEIFVPKLEVKYNGPHNMTNTSIHTHTHTLEAQKLIIITNNTTNMKQVVNIIAQIFSFFALCDMLCCTCLGAVSVWMPAALATMVWLFPGLGCSDRVRPEMA